MSSITSLDAPHTHLYPTTPSHYFQHLIITTLRQRGFDRGEAGALAEMERLLERHVQNLFEAASEYANLAHRSTSNASDLLSAQQETQSIRRSWKEVRRRRRGGSDNLGALIIAIDMEVVEERDGIMGEFRGLMEKAVGAEEGGKLEYAYDGAPSLPGEWTYALPDPSHPDAGRKETPVQVTAACLDFVRSTATERGDISPELGVVHYRKTAGGVGKRKWGVKGVGLA